MAQAPQGLDPTLNRLYKQAKKTKLLHISGRRLQKIPPQVSIVLNCNLGWDILDDRK